MEALFYKDQLDTAREAADLQKEQIREQQVQLRLQQNQNTIVRQQKLRQVIATEQVMAGVRGIDPASASLRAITAQNYVNFVQDETIDKINFGAKQQSLNLEKRMVNLRKHAQYMQATASLLNNIENTAAAVFTGNPGAVAASNSGGANMNLNG